MTKDSEPNGKPIFYYNGFLCNPTVAIKLNPWGPQGCKVQVLYPPLKFENPPFLMAGAMRSEVMVSSSLQCHDLHAKCHENLQIGSKVIEL
jgi:hypothetical protein